MQEFDLHYQLVKEDYLDWIHWNVARHSMKKMKIITAIIYAAFVLVYVGSSISSGKGAAALTSALLVVALVGAFMFYIISPRHQERTIWKRSGLQKLERKNGFPQVNLSTSEKSVTMEVPDQFSKEYYFPEIIEWEETERLYLMGTTEKTWQFIAKSAFDSEESKEAFKTFMIGKIADAKENPEKYEKEEEQAEILDEDSVPAEASYSNDDSDDDAEAVEIRHIDTSNMGKIGQMAHLMAALTPDPSEDESRETEEAAVEETTAERTTDTAEAAAPIIVEKAGSDKASEEV